MTDEPETDEKCMIGKKCEWFKEEHRSTRKGATMIIYKKNYIFLFIIGLLLLMLPLMAEAALVDQGTCGTNLTWTLDDAGKLSISGSGEMIDLPNRSDAWRSHSLDIITVEMSSGITSIGDNAFDSCRELRRIILPDNLSSIGTEAFYDCWYLNDVSLPNNLNIINNSAFNGCSSLRSITIPASVTYIGSGAFWYCEMLPGIDVDPGNSVYSSVDGVLFNKSQDLLISYPAAKANTAYIIPNTVTRIGESAFGGGSSNRLSRITIPDSVTNIGRMAFFIYPCTAVVDIPQSVTTIDELAFAQGSSMTLWVESDSTAQKYAISRNIPYRIKGEQHEGTLGGLTWTLTLDDIATLTISGTGMMAEPSETESWRQYSSYIKKIVINNGVTNIAENAFSNCAGLTSVSIPASVTSIGDWAFGECPSLTEFIINSGNTTFSAVDGILYNKSGNTLLYYPEGKSANCIVPNGTTNIANGAFKRHFNLKTVTIPASVTSIGDEAFSWCNYLTSAILSDGLISIGVDAFSPCISLENMVIPATVTNISEGAFTDCRKLHSITIPSGITAICDWTFAHCYELTSITIPENVISLGENALFHCFELSDIWYQGSEEQWARIAKGTGWNDSVPENMTIHFAEEHPIVAQGICGDNATWILDNTGILTISGTGSIENQWGANTGWDQYIDSIKFVVINQGITDISEYAFLNVKKMISISIPESVTNIGMFAFSGCTKLLNITIPTGVISIDNEAFIYCSSLTSIDVDNNNTVYSSYDGALYNKQMNELILCPPGKESIIIPKDVTSILTTEFSAYSTKLTPFDYNEKLKNIQVDRNNTVYSSNDGILYNKQGTELLRCPVGYKGSVSIPAGIVNIRHWAFDGCKELSSVSFPDSLRSIGEYVFNECRNLKNVHLEDGLTSIGYGAFYFCINLSSVNIPESITNIGHNAFFCCEKLGSIYIPSGITRINVSTFSGCQSLTEVIIPDEVTIIERWAFNYCKGLTSITIPAKVTSIGENALAYCSSLTDIWFTGTEEQWNAIEKGTDWSVETPSTLTVHFMNISIIDSGSWGDNLTYSLDSNGKLTISGTGPMPTEGKPWDYYDRRIMSVKVGYGITSVSNNAFAYLPNLTSATLADTVLMIGDCAFSYCFSLSSIVMPANVTSIGDCAFRLCRELSSIEFPASLSHIGNFAFTFCNSLSTITPDNVVMTEHTKYYEDSLYVFSLPATVTEIGYGAFIGTDIGQHASFNADFKIPSMITNIEEEAFMGINATHILLKPQNGNKVVIGKNAFANCSQLCYFEYNNGYYAAEPEIDPDAFNGCSSLTLIGRYNEELEQYAQDHGFEYMENEFYGGDG